jgi:membrane-bound lytic murein transglycosylase D
MRILKNVLWLGAVCVGLGSLTGSEAVAFQSGQAEKVEFGSDTLGIAAQADENGADYLPELEEIGANPAISEKLLRTRFAKLQKSIPLTYHKSSHEFVEYFIYKKTKFTRSMMEKMPLYFPLFEKTLQKHGLPVELKYLSMIESGLNPRALSRVRAGGLWQFMPATGREFGLYQDSYIDERFEPVKSTEAACVYLKQLYNIFGDWELALASYNTGPGNVKRAMRRSRGTTFWTIYNVLPRETRSYVPQYVAINYMMNYGNDHGIYPENPEYVIPHDTIHINGYIDLVAFCQNSGIELEELEKLNPHVTKSTLPDRTRNFVLHVPSVKYTYLLSNREAIMDSCTRRLLPGTMLARVDSSAVDSLGNPVVIRYASLQGDGEEEEEGVDDASGKPASRIVTKKMTHTVRRGETLLSISKKFRVEVSDLKKWNRLRKSNIMKGQRLVVYQNVKQTVKPVARVASAKSEPVHQTKSRSSHAKLRYHTVQQGDTLWTISQRYGLPLDHLRKANRIRGNEIRPGQKLIITG